MRSILQIHNHSTRPTAKERAIPRGGVVLEIGPSCSEIESSRAERRNTTARTVNDTTGAQLKKNRPALKKRRLLFV